MSDMFHGAASFNQSLNEWDVSKVWNMSSMFNGATVFNQPLDQWNVGRVTQLDKIFTQSAFNQSLDTWQLNPRLLNTQCLR